MIEDYKYQSAISAIFVICVIQIFLLMLWYIIGTSYNVGFNYGVESMINGDSAECSNEG